MKTKPFISLVCLFSRPETVVQWVENLNQIRMPREVIEAVFLIDGKTADGYDALEKMDFGSTKVVLTGNEPCSPVNTMERRKRITENMTRLQGMVGESQYIFGLEDDTYPPAHAFENLYALITGRGVGFVSGVEVGRWNLPYIGAWKVDENRGTGELHSLPYRKDHTQHIDAAGLYCYMTKTKYFKSARFSDSVFGPDINYVLSLRKKKLLCYVDWSVKCGHLIEKTNRMLYPDETSALVSLVKEDGYCRIVSHVPFVKQ